MIIQRLKKHPLVRFVLFPLIWVRRLWLRSNERRFDRAFERILGRVKSASLEVELAEFDGVFSIGRDSLLLKSVIREGSYEPELAELVRKHLDRNRDALDVGANVGFFSVLMGKLLASGGGRVCSVEPTPGALRRLRANLERNGVSNVVIQEGVLGAKAGLVCFNVVEGREEYSSMRPIQHTHALQFDTLEIQAPCRTLDSLVEEHGLNPGFVKMDVEGAEWDVFQGAVVTLSKYRPVILAELDDRLLSGFGTCCANVCRFLEEQGYQVLDARTGGAVRGRQGDTILAVPAKGVSSQSAKQDPAK